ncbi:hypothetical protein WG622_18035 [Cognatishimia sp. D5M38]|uniref:Tail assembly chaperone n=2 Tax=Cognatishimia coralii TaxID=3083254 RepID=A0ABU8QL53_9RHOB|nr:hypothetical protein [Donghicola eburneus]MCI5040726.1 hypothetical protein [Donghicola eburneus]
MKKEFEMDKAQPASKPQSIRELPMTFAQFYKTGRAVTIAQACEEMGVERDIFELKGGTRRVWIYADALYLIEKNDGYLWTLVARDEFASLSQSKVAAFLYYEWYCSEHVDRESWTLDTLTELATGWFEHHSITPASMDEALLDLIATNAPYRQISFAEWFIELWDEAERSQLATQADGYRKSMKARQ